MNIKALFSIFIILVSCRGENKHHFNNSYEEAFYKDYQGMDCLRFPLIAPYEIKEIDDNDNWNLKLVRGFDHYLMISNVDKVAVTNGVILAHSEKASRFSSDIFTNKYWFVIIPSKNVEIGFENLAGFNSYLKEIKVNPVNWTTTSSAFNEFKKTGCLPWITGCYSNNIERWLSVNKGG